MQYARRAVLKHNNTRFNFTWVGRPTGIVTNKATNALVFRFVCMSPTLALVGTVNTQRYLGFIATLSVFRLAKGAYGHDLHTLGPEEGL